jgi:hypothetical protein
MGWIVSAVIAFAFVFFGGAQVRALLMERGPTSLSCREFFERGAPADWVSLNDCTVDWAGKREFQETRYRNAVYVPVRQSRRPSRYELFIRVEPDEVGQDRPVWRGMLNTPSTDAVPDFANAPGVHILYTNRPQLSEMLLAVAPAIVFVVALTRSVRRARVRAADARRLRIRFPPAGESGDASQLDVTAAVAGSRAARGTALLGGISAALTLVVTGVSVETARATIWTMPAVLASALAAIAYLRHAALDARLLAIGTGAIGGSLVLTTALYLATKEAGSAVVALPLLSAGVWALWARRTLHAASNACLMQLIRGAPRVSRRRVSHSSASRRPVRVIAYRLSAGLAVLVGLMGIGVTGTAITLWVGLAVGVLLWNRGARHATFDARTVMERDPRPPVLLLRSFGDDDVEAKGRVPMPWSATQTLAFVAARCFQPVGPVIAVAPPNEKLPPLGPYRVFVQKDDWRVEVDRLIDTASIVVLFLGYSEGLLWELRRLLGDPHPRHLILVVPPADPASLEKRWDALIEMTAGHPAWRAVRDLDPLSTLLIRSLPDGRLTVFRGPPRHAAYEWAFQLCLAS